jgi:hypothetical protein
LIFEILDSLVKIIATPNQHPLLDPTNTKNSHPELETHHALRQTQIRPRYGHKWPLVDGLIPKGGLWSQFYNLEINKTAQKTLEIEN